MKKTKLIASSLIFAMMLPGTATAGEVGVSVSVDYVSEYVFRGVSFARGAVQPGIELSMGGAYAGVWSSAALGEVSSAAGDEIDVYAGYGWDLSDSISADVGATIYHFPDVDGSLFDFGGASTIEVYGGLSFDTALAPSVYAYYDFDLEALTVEGSVGHSFPMAESTSFDLGLSGGLVSASGGGDYEYGLGSAAVSYAFNDNASAYIGANYSLSSEDTLRFKVDGLGNGFTNTDNLLWFGVGVGTSF